MSYETKSILQIKSNKKFSFSRLKIKSQKSVKSMLTCLNAIVNSPNTIQMSGIVNNKKSYINRTGGSIQPSAEMKGRKGTAKILEVFFSINALIVLKTLVFFDEKQE